MKRLYNLGVYPEWWKLPPPSAAEWPAIDALIAERDPYCRGCRAAGLERADSDARARLCRRTSSQTCRGFAVGRTIFHEPARAWLAGAIDDAGLVTGVRANFEALIDAWTDARSDVRATPQASEAR